MARVFISHSWQDKSFVRRLASELTNGGLDVWVDEAEIKVGDSLIKKIREGIDTSDFVVAVISEASVRSKWVQEELDTAMNYQIGGRRTKVLPIIADPPSQITLPSFLVGKLYADMSSDEKFSQGLKALLTSLGVDYRQYRTVHSDALQQRAKVRLVSRRLVENLAEKKYDEAYGSLRALSSHYYEFAHDDLEFIDHLGRLIAEDAPIPFRRETISYLARSKNESFSIYLDPVFSSSFSNELLQDAVEAEIALGSQRHTWQILSLIEAGSKKSLLMKALTFFTRVRPKDEGFGVELLNRLTKLISAHRDDEAIRSAAVYAARWQVYDKPRIYTEFLLDNSPVCSDLVVEEVISMMSGGSGGFDQDYALSIVHAAKTKDFCKVILSRNSSHLRLRCFSFARSLAIFSDDELWELTDKWSDKEIIEMLTVIEPEAGASDEQISELKKLRDQRPQLLNIIDKKIAELDSDELFQTILAADAELSILVNFVRRLVDTASSFYRRADSSELGAQAIAKAFDVLCASFESLSHEDRLMYLAGSLLTERISVSAFAKHVKSLDDLSGNLSLFHELQRLGHHIRIDNDPEFQDALEWLGVRCGVYKDA